MSAPDKRQGPGTRAGAGGDSPGAARQGDRAVGAVGAVGGDSGGGAGEADRVGEGGRAGEGGPAGQIGGAGESGRTGEGGPAEASGGAGEVSGAGEGGGPDDGGGGDRAMVAAQLGRPPRAMRAVAHRCPCGLPDVVETWPRLPDGTPFPTLYYLTCPRASAAAGRLEASGVMREMTDRLRADPRLAERYAAAHEAYVRRRSRLGEVPEIAGVSAGGMPTRVKCLHALLAHSLAAGPGVNPLGDEVREAVGTWWSAGPCVTAGEPG